MRCRRWRLLPGIACTVPPTEAQACHWLIHCSRQVSTWTKLSGKVSSTATRSMPSAKPANSWQPLVRHVSVLAPSLDTSFCLLSIASKGLCGVCKTGKDGEIRCERLDRVPGKAELFRRRAPPFAYQLLEIRTCPIALAAAVCYCFHQKAVRGGRPQIGLRGTTDGCFCSGGVTSRIAKRPGHSGVAARVISFCKVLT